VYGPRGASGAPSGLGAPLLNLTDRHAQLELGHGEHQSRLHGNTVVAAKRRDELEKLCRYDLRPPFSEERLEKLPDSHVVYTLKRAWSKGTTQLLFTPEVGWTEGVEWTVTVRRRPR
jgi:hypothetical protein